MSEMDDALKSLDAVTPKPGRGRKFLLAGAATAAVPLLAVGAHKAYQHLHGRKREEAEALEKQAQYDVLRASGLVR